MILSKDGLVFSDLRRRLLPCRAKSVKRPSIMGIRSESPTAWPSFSNNGPRFRYGEPCPLVHGASRRFPLSGHFSIALFHHRLLK
jgi:hypothetical protein